MVDLAERSHAQLIGVGGMGAVLPPTSRAITRHMLAVYDLLPVLALSCIKGKTLEEGTNERNVARRVAGADKGRRHYRFLQCTTAQYMTRSVTSVTRDVTRRELELLFERHDFNSFPVLGGGKMIGIVTKFEFLKAFAFTTGQMVPHYDELMRRTVADVMSETVVHVEPTTSLTRVLELMVSRMTRSLPVMSQEGQSVGMISREDVMRALREATNE